MKYNQNEQINKINFINRITRFNKTIEILKKICVAIPNDTIYLSHLIPIKITLSLLIYDLSLSICLLSLSLPLLFYYALSLSLPNPLSKVQTRLPRDPRSFLPRAYLSLMSLPSEGKNSFFLSLSVVISSDPSPSLPLSRFHQLPPLPHLFDVPSIWA
jgi:hypothetical protein